jgi:hypothetical protein
LEKELDLFDIADWLWSFRWLALGMAAIALVWTVFALVGARGASAAPAAVTPPTYLLTINIYSSGTPVRAPADIADIYATRLSSESLRLASNPGAEPIIFTTTDRATAEAGLAAAEQIAEQLVADVRSQAAFLTRYKNEDPLPEAAATQYIRSIAFLEGLQSGLFDLASATVTEHVRAEVADNESQTNSNMLTRLLMPWIFCGFAFLAIAGSVSFANEWQKRRLGSG